MSYSEIHGEGWRLRLEREGIRVDYADATEPDPEWSFVDAAFHGHRYVEAPEGPPSDAPEHYPTLRIVGETYWCDEHGEEHYSTRFVCRLCGGEIRPGTRAANPTGWVAGPMRATLTLDLELESLTLEEVLRRAGGRPTAPELLDLIAEMRTRQAT